jgi:hypothetical protein
VRRQLQAPISRGNQPLLLVRILRCKLRRAYSERIEGLVEFLLELFDLSAVQFDRSFSATSVSTSAGRC